MGKNIIRKTKITLQNNIEEKNKVTFTINIDSNHINNQLDSILNNIESCINLANYTVQNDCKEVKEKPVTKGKSKKQQFTNGSYV